MILIVTNQNIPSVWLKQKRLWPHHSHKFVTLRMHTVMDHCLFGVNSDMPHLGMRLSRKPGKPGLQLFKPVGNASQPAKRRYKRHFFSSALLSFLVFKSCDSWVRFLLSLQSVQHWDLSDWRHDDRDPSFQRVPHLRNFMRIAVDGHGHGFGLDNVSSSANLRKLFYAIFSWAKEPVLLWAIGSHSHSHCHSRCQPPTSSAYDTENREQLS